MKLKYYHPFFLFIFILSSCSNKNSSIDHKYAYNKTYTYLKQQKDFKSEDTDEIGNYFLMYADYTIILKKRLVFLGKINSDTLLDATASYEVVQNNKHLSIHHLIWLNNGKDLEMAKDIKREMKIKGINNQEILAEQSLLAKDSPNFGCEACYETIKLKFSGDSLVQTK